MSPGVSSTLLLSCLSLADEEVAISGILGAEGSAEGLYRETSAFLEASSAEVASWCSSSSSPSPLLDLSTTLSLLDARRSFWTHLSPSPAGPLAPSQSTPRRLLALLAALLAALSRQLDDTHRTLLLSAVIDFFHTHDLPRGNGDFALAALFYQVIVEMRKYRLLPSSQKGAAILQDTLLTALMNPRGDVRTIAETALVAMRVSPRFFQHLQNPQNEAISDSLKFVRTSLQIRQGETPAEGSLRAFRSNKAFLEHNSDFVISCVRTSLNGMTQMDPETVNECVETLAAAVSFASSNAPIPAILTMLRRFPVSPAMLRLAGCLISRGIPSSEVDENRRLLWNSLNSPDFGLQETALHCIEAFHSSETPSMERVMLLLDAYNRGVAYNSWREVSRSQLRGDVVALAGKLFREETRRLIAASATVAQLWHIVRQLSVVALEGVSLARLEDGASVEEKGGYLWQVGAARGDEG